jgi:prepilin-type processing-associated H-X9-DG protein
VADRLNILLSGMIAAEPGQGGATWAVLQYLLGLRQLGHRVLFVEGIQDTSLSPKAVPLDRTWNAGYFRRVMEDFGFDRASALLVAGTLQTFGLPYEHLRRVARSADVLINISGILADEELTANPGGINVLFADGGVRFVRDGIDRMVWWSLGTKAGGEIVSSDQY